MYRCQFAFFRKSKNTNRIRIQGRYCRIDLGNSIFSLAPTIIRNRALGEISMTVTAPRFVTMEEKILSQRAKT